MDLRRGGLAPLAVCVAAGFLLAACGGRGSGSNPSDGASGTKPTASSKGATFGAAAAGSHVGGGTATVRLPGDWVVPFDPAKTTATASHLVLFALYERLVALGPDGKLIPYLAESWKQTPDSVTFTLREGPTCADGTAVTPTVVKHSVERALDPKTASVLPSFLGSGPITVQADDAAKTVTVTSAKPYNEMLAAFAHPASGILCPAGMADGADLETKSYGSGPWVVESSAHNDSVTMKVRRDWKWGPLGTTAATLPDTLIFRVVASEATAANLLQSGGLDIGKVAGADVQRLRANKSLLYYPSASTATHYITFNLSREPYKSNAKFRETLLTAIDRRQFNTAELGGTGLPADGLFGKGMDCAADMTQYIPKPDPARAKTLLAEAGYGPGGKPLTVELLASVAQLSAPEYLSSALEAIGVKVKNRTVPVAQYATELYGGAFDMTAPAGASPSPAPTAMARYLIPPAPAKGGADFARANDPKLAELSGAAQSADEANRCAKWEEFQKYYLTQFYGMPTGADVSQWFSRGYDILPKSTFHEPWAIAKRK